MWTATDFSGLNSLEIISGFLAIGGCSNFKRMHGLNSLLEIGGLSIQQMDSLHTVELPQTIRKVGSIFFHDNPGLIGIEAIPVNEIEGRISIFFNDNLLNLDGLSNISSLSGVGYVEIISNESLTSIIGLENIDINTVDFENRHKDGFIIAGNPLLPHCAITPICNSINQSKGVYVSSNGVGCNSIGEILPRCITSVESSEDLEDISLFPNPTPSRFYLKGINKADYKIYDISGRTAQIGVIDDGPIDTKGIGKGMFIVEIKSNTKTVRLKLIKL